MKSDVIRKRSRHDARRINAAADTPTASPGVSRRPSPVRDISPTLAPDSTTQLSFEYHEESEYRSSRSELMGALGPEANHHKYAFTTFASFPGPYHPDYIMQFYNAPPADALPFTSVDIADMDSLGMNRRTTKRRRMSTDSASEPPSSATSYSSYNDGYSTSSPTSHSQRSSMEFPFSAYPHFHILRGSGNTFWHPPMLPQDRSPQFIHPPMLPPAEESPMDYLHPPMLPHDEDSLFSAYFHPPMLPPDDGQNASMSNMQFSNEGMYPGPDHYDTNMHTY
jgi:GATA-binding protein